VCCMEDSDVDGSAAELAQLLDKAAQRPNKGRQRTEWGASNRGGESGVTSAQDPEKGGILKARSASGREAATAAAKRPQGGQESRSACVGAVGGLEATRA
jgi:hypothetical protein